VGGKEYRLYPFTLDDLGELQAWVNSVTPDPFALAQEQIASGRFTVEQGKYLLRVAMEMASKGAPKIGTDEADYLIQSTDGIKEVLYLTIRKGDPKFTREAADGLFRQVSQSDVASVFRASGLEEAGIVGAVDDPKAGGSPTPTAGESPSTGGPSTTTS
jgi:hypothetical protein